MAEDPEGPDNLNEPPSFFPYEGEPRDRVPGSMGELIEVTVEGVFAAENSGNITRFILLTDGERKLPILIGPYEAQAIILPLEGTRPDRPMSHDLIHNVIERLGYSIDRIVIDDLWNSVYYAKIYLRKGKEEIEMDARPSDAIALAVRFEAHVYVADAIMNSDMME
jgi:bifunctional DNase/RNase